MSDFYFVLCSVAHKWDRNRPWRVQKVSSVSANSTSKCKIIAQSVSPTCSNLTLCSQSMPLAPLCTLMKLTFLVRNVKCFMVKLGDSLELMKSFAKQLEWGLWYFLGECGLWYFAKARKHYIGNLWLMCSWSQEEPSLCLWIIFSCAMLVGHLDSRQ